MDIAIILALFSVVIVFFVKNIYDIGRQKTEKKSELGKKKIVIKDLRGPEEALHYERIGTEKEYFDRLDGFIARSKFRIDVLDYPIHFLDDIFRNSYLRYYESIESKLDEILRAEEEKTFDYSRTLLYPKFENDENLDISFHINRIIKKQLAPETKDHIQRCRKYAKMFKFRMWPSVSSIAEIKQACYIVIDRSEMIVRYDSIEEDAGKVKAVFEEAIYTDSKDIINKVVDIQKNIKSSLL